MSKKAEMYEKELEVQDPLVERLGDIGGEDFEYFELLQHIANRTKYIHLTIDCELRLIRDSIPRLGIIELEKGTRFIVRDGSEILIPRPAREEIVRNLHLTHAAPETMMLLTKGRLFWPKMQSALETHYTKCKPCTENRIPRAQKPNEVDISSVFQNFFPNVRVQIDYAERGNDNFIVICDQMSGFSRFARHILKAQSRPC